MTRVGDNRGKGVYTYIFETEPTGLLFANVENNSATTQTADFEFVNGGYYTPNGLKAVVPEAPTTISQIENSKFANSKCYDLQGRRINGKPMKGLYIINGRKYAVK